MYPLSDAKLEKISNNEIIRRILELQNTIAIISDNMEVLKYRNKLLDEENVNLQNHIKNIVNEVKTEYSQNANKKKQTPSKYPSNHFTENKYINPPEHTTSLHNNDINYLNNIQSQNKDETKLIQKNNMDSQNNTIDKNLSERIFNKLPPQEYTNDNEKPNCENHLENRNIKNNPSEPGIGIKDANYIYNENDHNNDKRDCENFQDFNNHSSKKNIYNLIMETEKINSIFSMASNVLNTSFFNVPKDPDIPKAKYPNIVNKNHIKNCNTSSPNTHKLADDLVNKTASIDNKTYDHLSEQKNNIESYDQTDKEVIDQMGKSNLNVNLPSCVENLSANEGERNSKNATNEEENDNKNDANDITPNNKQNI
ncbi:conserved Plasmodium protein, unknown function [Plasmodium vinckei vinckei]|uniref:Uncharacterized protein n=1 Tax=Plasmodium vinckei vinckei TaxID=54757 RepID=A0A449BZE9_PLAVN|nr:conserved Plasmodium protein, unknown function [Plasmodium vinckei vinckei]KEG04351.1 hypothetical protein YYE_01257 [Plasmodium vinckei vinckei]VEV58848.1 conserved Plasmodium protein, unknown function [Plasmodium vinckei vinckei]